MARPFGDILNCLLASDLPPEWQELSRSLGLPAVRALLSKYGGTQIYIPKTASITKFVTRMSARFNKMSNREFAALMGVSESFVRNIRKKG